MRNAGIWKEYNMKGIKYKQPKMGHKETIVFLKTVVWDGKAVEYTMV